MEVDEGQISQVIQNLVINARQSMPKGGIIEIKAENCRVTPDTKEDPFVKSGEYVKIQVKDAGSGIPKEMLQRIFDPYFTTKEKGTGLGLAISYSIIKRHNGYITARSLPGDGTVFAILLPAIPGYSAPAKDNPTGLVKGKGRILLMDDEEAVLKTGGECLRYLGYDVECSSDGNEAVQKYKKSCDLREPFDLVILDLTVPGGLSGQETMQKLIEVDPRVKGIVSSGYSDSVILSEFRKFGFVGKISKPYRIEELSRALSMALGR